MREKSRCSLRRRAPSTLLAAAAHPDLISRLVLFGATASWLRSDDLPDEWSADQWAAEWTQYERATILSQWIDLYARNAAPSLMTDDRSRRGFHVLVANTSGLKSTAAETRMLSQVDLRHLLPSVKQPVLVSGAVRIRSPSKAALTT